MSYKAQCPHCGSAGAIRTSRAVTSTYRTMQVWCQNIDCAAIFGAALEITHQIRPSMTPNPAVLLRTSPPRARAVVQAPANDGGAVEVPTPANDEGTDTMTNTG